MTSATHSSPGTHGSGLHNLRPGDARAVLSIGHLLGAGAAAMSQTVRHWWARHTQRNHLATLDEHLLRDIGMTRLDALRESRKAFWER